MGKPQKTSQARSQQNAAPTLTQQQTAAYIADITLGLRGMADRAELPFLTYLGGARSHAAERTPPPPPHRQALGRTGGSRGCKH